MYGEVSPTKQKSTNIQIDPEIKKNSIRTSLRMKNPFLKKLRAVSKRGHLNDNQHNKAQKSFQKKFGPKIKLSKLNRIEPEYDPESFNGLTRANKFPRRQFPILRKIREKKRLQAQKKKVKELKEKGEECIEGESTLSDGNSEFWMSFSSESESSDEPTLLSEQERYQVDPQIKEEINRDMDNAASRKIYREVLLKIRQRGRNLMKRDLRVICLGVEGGEDGDQLLRLSIFQKLEAFLF